MKSSQSYSTTWKDLKGIVLSEISQTEKRQILYDFICMWDLKNEINKQAKQKQIQIQRTF